MDLIGYAARLGEELDRRYTRAQHNAREFHRVASDVLAAHREGLRVAAEDVVVAAMRADLPWQFDVDSTFGEPAVTLYTHPRFRIDALCWRNGTTAIHQHQFAGAFLVLCGASVQTVYRFTPAELVSEAFLVGRLEYHDSRILGVGDLEPIELGERLIHAVFHLESPSITLVVRTHNNVPAGPQFQYEPPCVAYDPFAKDYQTAKRLQIVDYLCDVQPAGFESSIADLLRRGTIPLAFAVLRRVRMFRRVDRAAWTRLFEAAVEAHGRVMAALGEVFEHVERERTLMALRRSTTDATLRYFLALLLNIPRGRDIRRAVAERVGPERAVDLMIDWTAAIKALPGSREPLTDTDRRVLRAVLSADERHPIVAASEPGEHAGWQQSYERLRTSVLLRPLFDGGSGLPASQPVDGQLVRQ